MMEISEEIRETARGFKLWPVENALEFPDKDLPLGDAILNSEHGAVLTAGGILQLTGQGKIGKSMLVLGIAFPLALGRDALGFGMSKPRKVFYLNGENSPGTMQDRLRCLRDYFCIDHEEAELVRQNLLFASVGLPLPKPEAMKEMRGNLAEVRPDVLIIDPLKNFFSGEENSADDMRKFMGAVRELMAEFNLTVIIVHHTGKRPNEADIYTGRGSSVLGDDAEATASFRKEGAEKGRFTLSVTGRNCDEFTLHLIRSPERWFLYSLADAPEPKPDHVVIEIIDALPDEFTSGQFHEQADRRGISKRTADRRLRDAISFPLIRRGGKVGQFIKLNIAPSMPNPKEMAQVANSQNGNMPCMPNMPDDTSGIKEPDDEFRGVF
ncbi:MAG: AAA family ATPase [Desulfobulbaceae bacterium]|nr:AAA family ATPase [Desulfobulbaceae bacterium]